MKYNWFEGSVPRSGFMVYHLRAEVGARELGKFMQRDYFFSEVYLSRKKAEAAGRKFLKSKVKDIYRNYYKDIFSSFKEFHEWSIRNIGKYSSDDEIYGGFTITEFDPLLRENYDKYEQEYDASHPYDNGRTISYAYMRETEYTYNILGNITHCWVKPQGHFHFPEDNLPNAGLMFKNGDFVTTNVDNHKRVYIVSGTPDPERVTKLKEDPYWENTIQLDYIDEDDNSSYVWDYSMFSDCQLRIFEGEV